MTLRFLDTNILLYSISRDPAEEPKRRIAIALLDDDAASISVQVLQEFYVQATRVSRTDRLPHDLAAGLIQTWLRFKVQEMTVALMQAALDIRAATGFSYWDSAIIAAASAAGCHELMTEDLAHGQEVADVLIVNPFLGA